MEENLKENRKEHPLWLQRIAMAAFITVAIQIIFIYVKYGEVWRTYEFTFWIEFTFTFFYFIALFWTYPKISSLVHSTFVKHRSFLQVNIIEGVSVVVSTFILTLIFKLLPMGGLLFFLNFLSEDLNLRFDLEAVRQSLIIHAVLGLLLYYFVERERIRKQIKAEHLRLARLQREDFKRQLENLKNQVNPHFLFSSLKTLDSLIVEKSDKADGFVKHLSIIYRSFLDRQEQLVPLSKELKLAEAYMFILKARFKDHICFSNSVPSDYLHLRLPPGSLQVLLENIATASEKHREYLLNVTICAKDGKLKVFSEAEKAVNYQLSGTDMENLMKRYSYFTDEIIEMDQTSTKLEFKLPLLKVEKDF